MHLEACLPPSLRGPETRITSISDGLSGAGVYRVDAGDLAFVLKVAPEHEASARWPRALAIWRQAAAAGLTPALVHVDETRRAVLTALVVDRSFPVLYRDPLSQERALAELGRTLRCVHALPLPSDGESAEAAAAPWTLLPTAWGALTTAGIAVPDFVRRAAEGLLTEVPPESGRAPVLSHNDVHPKNLVHDGARLYLMDWDAAGPNNPFSLRALVPEYVHYNAVVLVRGSAHLDKPDGIPCTYQLGHLAPTTAGFGSLQSHSRRVRGYLTPGNQLRGRNRAPARARPRLLH